MLSAESAVPQSRTTVFILLKQNKFILLLRNDKKVRRVRFLCESTSWWYRWCVLMSEEVWLCVVAVGVTSVRGLDRRWRRISYHIRYYQSPTLSAYVGGLPLPNCLNWQNSLSGLVKWMWLWGGGLRVREWEPSMDAWQIIDCDCYSINDQSWYGAFCR